MLNQRLSQKLQQKLSPQQIQLMKLLQVPTATLEQRIEEELEANPALDEGQIGEEPARTETKEKEEEPETDEIKLDDDLNVDDYFSSDDDVASYKLKDSYNGYDPDDENKTIPVAVGTTFHEQLTKQLGLQDLDDREYTIGNQLIGSIDDDGYLRRELEAIVDDLAFSANVMTEVEELENVLMVIQKFEPAGVAARDLRECLLLQLGRKDDTPTIELATKILDKYFDTFAKKHYTKLERSLGLTSAELKEAIDEVLKLNPKPGGAYASKTSANIHQYIIPDYYIENQNGELVLRLNAKNAPELRVSNSFKDMLTDYNKSKEKDKKQKEALLFIKQKIDSAKWFIEAIRQRQQTMINTMRTIMEHQYEFFLTGDETKLNPMILKDIAEITHLDISTVSRVANSKYVQTEFGTYLLKYFFSESLSTDSGEEVSTREVKKILTDIIDEENKRKPLSDQKLTEMLQEKGYNIARRTVAKYREQLNLPVARLRKEL